MLRGLLLTFPLGMHPLTEARLEALEQEDTSSFYAPIKKTKMDFFQQDKLRTIAKEKVLKEDVRSYRNCSFPDRTENVIFRHDRTENEFFRHENQSFPASLSNGGRLHVCQISQVATVLEGKVTLPDAEPVTDAIIMDGSALVN